MSLFITIDELHRTINDTCDAHMREIAESYPDEIKDIVARTPNAHKLDNVFRTIFCTQADSISGLVPNTPPKHLFKRFDEETRKSIDKYYQDHPNTDYWIDMLDLAKCFGYSEKTAKDDWISRGWIKDGYYKDLKAFEPSKDKLLRHKYRNALAIKESMELVVREAASMPPHAPSQKITITVYKNDDYTRCVLDDKRAVTESRKYINYKAIPALVSRLGPQYNTDLFSGFVSLLMEYQESLNETIGGGLLEKFRYIACDLSMELRELRADIRRSLLDSRITHDKLDDQSRALRKVSRKLDRVIPVVENDTNKRCVIVYRKASWKERRYKVVGRLTSDKAVKDLQKNRDKYEVFKYYEHINNPAKAKTDIISEYRDKKLLIKDKIKDDDGTEISVVRLGERAYKQFIADLEDQDKNYEVLASDDGDDGQTSLATARS